MFIHRIIAILRPSSPPRLHKGQASTPSGPECCGLPRQSPFETKRTEICLARDTISGPTAGLVLRGGARLERDKACQVFIVQIRPGTMAHRDGAIRPGDRLLAINGIDLTGLHLDDIYGLLADFYIQQSSMPNGPNHQPQPLKLLIEYNILKASDFESGLRNVNGADEWVMEFCRQSGSDIGLSLVANYVEGRHCMVVESVRPASFADRTGVIKPGDILLSINNQSVDNKMPSDVMHILRYGSSLSSTTASSPKVGNTVRLQFMRQNNYVAHAFVHGGGTASNTSTMRRDAASPYASRPMMMSQSYHACMTSNTATTGSGGGGSGGGYTKRNSTLDARMTQSQTAGVGGDSVSNVGLNLTPTIPRATHMSSSLMMPATGTTNSMTRLKRRGSIGEGTCDYRC